jgi:ribosomal protein S18 acetylase RimI-like enzyme
MAANREIATIRIATPDDAQALATMHIASWHETYSGLLPNKMLAALSVAPRAAAWSKILLEAGAGNSTVVYLAERQGTIIGFGSCGVQRTESLKEKGYDGEISSVYVLREFQKRKIGTHLFRAMSSDLISRGFNAAALWVLRENLRARRFYEHFGGKVISERDDVRDGTILVELAYGWPELKELNRRAQHD